MSNNNQVVVVVASNFQSFIGSMKANLKLGYARCEEATYVNGFFRARLVKDTDEAYVARLSGISGEERENVLDLVSYLDIPTTIVTLEEYLPENSVKEAEIVGRATEQLQKEAVNTTIKRDRKARSKK